ncbi:hybrid sensor histidine kinase/response regulator [Caenimonas soli]|uniref:hybrid sensor histidine kinase/response regulator n=1 Tax=Caenimonas soli TaxID=2735555 RepID=UPI001554873F|nr:hybrid sensor histidine kinase/response regulator [Caenimonas soli]NPC54209.1 response regulator [Caenimonas soli]
MSSLSGLWGRLFAHYESYHAYGPPRLKYAGYIGAISYSLFYFLRFTRPGAQPFDDLLVRTIAIALLLGLALKDYWPEKFRRYYIAYSYPALLYALPCFTVLTGLQRGGGIPAISNAFIILCFLVLLTDWRNTLVMLGVGTSAAVALYLATSPDPKLPMDLVAQLPAFALIVIGGNLFKFSTEQIDAERKLRATQALAGSIAHEMRNPLSQIRHNLESMQQALPPPTTTARAQTLAALQVDTLYRQLAESEMAVKRGLQVIAMTLDEVSAKPVDTSAFSYLSAVEATDKAVQEYAFASDAERRRVSVQVIEDFTFRADETAYLFVLFNLIKNALYYLALDESAKVTITVVDHKVKVRDTGPGIAPEVLAKLFQPFSSVGKAGGTGLGLAYCRRVMRAFGGDIECESVQGQYTLFTLRFPQVSAQESQAHHFAVMTRAREAFAGKRLLIVDDDAAQRMTTRHKLAPLEAEIDQAADGQRALEALARQRYDLVLLDLNMPVLDGYAVAAKVRQGQVPANRDVAIVAYTSEPAHLASVKTQKAGMDGFIAKPCAQLPLVQALHRALDRPTAQPAGVLAGRRVLLADDNPFNRKAVAAYLKHAGATVVEVSHGRAALEHLQSPGPWDAVLLDINMPGMDGLETTRAIRYGGMPSSNVPIVALTAHSDARTVGAAQAAGMNGFITKPVEAAALYRTLGNFFSGVALPTSKVLAAQGSAPAHEGRLLDVDRLESYRRIGMLDELLDDYVPEIARLVERLQRGVAAEDLAQSLDALHSLLGMSGEAGASALYRLVRAAYVPMVEARSWPAQSGWLEQISAATTQTQSALRAYARMQPTD